MKITTSRDPLKKIKCDGLAITLFEGEKPSGEISSLDKAVSGAISEVIKLGEFKGKLYKVTSIFTHKKIPSTRILLVGAGKRNEFDPRIARNLAGAVGRRAMKIGIKRLAVYLGDDETSEQALEGVLLAAFDPGIYKTKKEEGAIEELIVIGKLDEKTKKHATVVSEATNWVRKLINSPANLMTPAKMVEEAKRLAKDYKFTIEIFDEKEAEKKGLGAFLGVAKGSEEPSYMVVLKYKGRGKETLGIVGKGITFDSGGISLKPGENMHKMKMDMSGAAACFGLMKIIGELRPRTSIIMVTPLTENLPGGKALKPGDVLKSYSGKTIEVLNTDAEGRVVLSDALTLVQKDGATKIVELSTLTGAVIVALGRDTAAILGNKGNWTRRVLEASKMAGERLWQLPLFPEHKELLKSEIADVSNIPPTRGAGTIAGGVFLQEFIEKNVSWAHLDIAGTAWLDGEKPYMAKGPTGFGVRTLVKLIEDLDKSN